MTQLMMYPGLMSVMVINLAPMVHAGLMDKLNQRKIRWICREIEKGELSVCRIARLQPVAFLEQG